MVYFTGDIHGSPSKIKNFCKRYNLRKEDIVIILGDVGANYSGDFRDDHMKSELAALKPTILCIHGNHEIRPRNIKGYRLVAWNGGMVWKQERYPNLLFAEDGEIYTINNINYLVIGGAYSVDKYYRLSKGYGWWDDEQPSEETKKRVEEQILNNHIDIVLSHTCPAKYTPTEAFLPMIDQSSVDRSTELWLNKIERSLSYKAWYCGHWHIDKNVDKLHFLFNSFDSDAWLTSTE
ncbi:MAG: metallophosphoesterase [Ruminococcaceae bacterium]|nr:metallophosphoesterase [Oscillospiraceae bacterium]